jgi:tRNA(Arg) A34 adenosine deaminase TadA
MQAEGLPMSDRDEINRRDFIVTTAGVAGGASAFAGVAPAQAQTQIPPPPGFADQDPINQYWTKQLRDIVSVDLSKDAPELADDAVKERHRIYCHLLMKLIVRFWNGNKRGPIGSYPLRKKQIEAQQSQGTRYKGDMITNPEGSRINWDRYLGHNIACLAVDGNGEIIDFDFNHNEFFRSSAEHAESRMVRRLFSLADIRDSWKTGQPIDNKSRAFSLNKVTLYTSLESCAQCSGVMSLGGVKQIIYLQNDFTAYMIGNIMYNLANRNGKLPGAPIPIPGSEIGLTQFKLLNDANLTFAKNIADAEKRKDSSQAFFVSQDGSVKDFAPSITSFLCTDDAYDIFKPGGDMLDTMTLNFPERRHPNDPDHPEILTNLQCLKEAMDFYKYADIEGYRGSPHKL